MPTPCREQVVAAIKTALDGITGIVGLTVERDRDEHVEEADLPKLALFEGDESLAPDFSGEDGFELQVDIEGYAALADLAVLRASVDAAIFADRTLGGLARDIDVAAEAGPQRLDMDSAAPTKSFVRSYRVLYATVEGDPFTFA